MTGGIHRLLSKRDKRNDSPSRKNRFSLYLSPNSTATRSAEIVNPDSVADFYDVFSDSSKINPVEEPKIKSLRNKIIASKSVLVKDDNILWCLRCNFSKGDTESAYDLLSAMTDASVGLISPFDPQVKLLGAVNRQAVTCFLDSVLFAMFSRLDSFEAMLYNSFEDRSLNRLGFLIRLWVNLLRAGRLIATDVTKVIQETLSECGWTEAGTMHQQDASEAFTFITEKLKLPLLTLKMDMFHAGKQDDDDHRFINERLLEVAIPANENGEHKDIKLEDCLEDYFNNRIEVRRFLERRSTMKSISSIDYPSKQGAVHVEAVEVEDVDTPLTPLSALPSRVTSSRPTRSRATSIIQERFVPEKESEKEVDLPNGTVTEIPTRLRKGSLRKEVLMPAWQFFSLIPWYTNHAPSNDAQVAQHFSSKRPIIGLCLKRYQMTVSGRTVRLNTYIDIPVEIGLPHFIQDDKMDEKGPLYGTFKLCLQSVVCHRGNSVDSGHYISLVRATPNEQSIDADQWMRFDDLASQRVTMIDINHALREEMPYLLFYQIVPVDGEVTRITTDDKPPSYTGSQVMDSSVSGMSTSPEFARSDIESLPQSGRPSFDLPPLDDHRATIMPTDLDRRPSSGRPSFEFSLPDNHRATLMPSESRRPSSIAFPGQLSVSTSPRSGSIEGTSRRKSASIGRSLSRNSRRLSKRLSSLTGSSKNKDEKQMSKIIEPIGGSQNEVGGTPDDALARLTGEIPEKATGHYEVPESNNRGRTERRNKSKNRLTKMYMGGLREDKPDRECVVM